MVSENLNNYQDSRFICFKLEREDYGLNVARAMEVIRIVALSHLPETPKFVSGIINLRGQFIPVIDMRVRLDLPAHKYHLNTPIIITKAEKLLLGLIVDRVTEVVTIPENQIIAPGEIGAQSALVAGLANNNGKLLFLIEPDKILSPKETIQIKKVISENAKNKVKDFLSTSKEPKDSKENKERLESSQNAEPKDLAQRLSL